MESDMNQNPVAPLRPCKRPGCVGSAVPGTRYCAAHAGRARAEVAAARALLDADRGTAHERGYTSTWSTYARGFRARFPLSPGYLTRTAYWTPQLAQRFHALRLEAVAAGRFLDFLRALAAGDRLSTLSSQLSALQPLPFAVHLSPSPEAAAEVDHIIPVSGPGDPLFWAEWNHQALSKAQHSEKTAKHDGGFRGARAPSLNSQLSTLNCARPAGAGLL